MIKIISYYHLFFCQHLMYTGYGRQEVAGILLEAGCNIDALNNSKQAPIDVARMNREVSHIARVCSLRCALPIPQDDGG